MQRIVDWLAMRFQMPGEVFAAEQALCQLFKSFHVLIFLLDQDFKSMPMKKAARSSKSGALVAIEKGMVACYAFGISGSQLKNAGLCISGQVLRLAECGFK